VEDAVELQNALLDRLLNAAERSLASKREQLLQTFYGLSRVMQERIVAGRQALERLLVGIFRSAEQGLTIREKRVAELETILAKKDPSPWLAAGWTQLWNAQGVLLGVDQTKIGDQVKARLKDGLLDLTVKSIDEVEHGKGKGV
jgi:exonuclease VII large subunit